LQVSIEVIKELREKTGAGVIDCKNALLETEGNLEKASEILNQRGIALAQKKADRTAEQGLIECYVHAGGKIGVMVEVNCETDFVARTNEFKELAHDLALQVAAMSPECISQEELPLEADSDLQTACLLLQPFIKDPTKTIQDIITETIAKVGENIKVRRFTRFELGC
jgi:elongation factor Ts